MENSYVQQLKNINIQVSDESLSSNVKQTLECLSCQHKWQATPKSKMQNFRKHGKVGCPQCTFLGKQSNIRIDNIAFIKEKFEILSSIDLRNFNNNLMLTVRNIICNHVFTSKTGNLLNRDVTCPVCNTEVKRNKYLKFNEERHQDAVAGKTGFAQYNMITNKLTRETYRKHSNIINPNKLQRMRSGQNGYHLDHIISKKYCFENNIPPEICAHPDNLRMIYWKENAEKWKKPQVFFPQIFSKYVTAFDKIINFVKIIEERYKIKSFATDLLVGHTLTIVDEEHKTVIQFLSLNENLEKHTGTRNYNKTLQMKLEKLGYRLIAIFEDEWDKNPQLILNKINHILGENKTTSIMARKCLVRLIDVKEKNNFLNQNHIQGTSISQINLGAFFNNTLVAVMTFCRPRILMNKKIDKSKNSWELARFATDNNYRVVGISSKLLSYFMKNNLWDDIYSYADMRWSVGNLYLKLGFELAVTNPPEYHYVVDNKRKHRWGYRKDALREKFPNDFDSSKTEYQNMLSMGFDRVWDCGTLKFVINKNGSNPVLKNK